MTPLRWSKGPGHLGIGINLGFRWFKIGIAWALERV